MTLRHLKIFVTVCECNSITLAAEKLYLAQPAVSLAISEIEGEYNIKLFDRISRKLYITQTGRRLLKYATNITAMFDEMETDMTDKDRLNSLRVGSSITIGTYLMPEYVKRFSIMYPAVSINVVIDNSETIESKILDNVLDFALIEGSAHSQYIISEPFLDDKLVFICSPENPILSDCQSISLNDITTQSFLLREKGSGTREIVDSILTSHGVTLTPHWESASTQAIIHAVKYGLGVSILPFQLVQRELQEGLIRTLPVDGVDFKRKFSVIHHKNKYLSKSAKLFMNMCFEKSTLMV